MGKLRIMRVIARMNVGGPAVQVSGLMRRLPGDRFEHRLYTGWCAEDEADYLETQAPDVPAVRIDGLGRSVSLGDDAIALRALIREIRQFRPHLVHTHTAKAGVLGRLAARLSGVSSATVHTFHGHLLHGYFSPAKTRAVIGIEQALARFSDRLVAVGPHVRDDLLKVGIGRPEQFSIIPPGLEMPTPKPRDEARIEFGLDKQSPVIAFVGRLTAIKRPDRFIEVVERVTQQRPDAQFLVAGEGDESGLVREAAERLPITMLGWRSDIENVLVASDAVLLTSDNEGTPLSLIQAAMAGLPVIASSVGSVPAVVVDGQTGWLAPPETAPLSASVIELLSDKSESTRRGEAGRARAVQLYGVERLADDHAALYEEVASSRMR